MTIAITLYIIGFLGVGAIHVFGFCLGNGFRTSEWMGAILATVFWPLTILYLVGKALWWAVEFHLNKH